jgi:hypothetical protein
VKGLYSFSVIKSFYWKSTVGRSGKFSECIQKWQFFWMSTIGRQSPEIQYPQFMAILKYFVVVAKFPKMTLNLP